MTRGAALRLIKLLHTVIWLIFAVCIVAIPIFGFLDQFRTAAWLVCFVMLEVLVLAFNGLRCPLTGAAARYTENRRDNFDIYLPAWLARRNKLLFGTLFVAGTLFTFARWTGATHALLIWLGFVLLAVLNGGFRQRVLFPLMGEQTGHVVSTVILSTAIMFITWATLLWIAPATLEEAWRLGALWLGMTIAFEFLMGHYLFHTPWTKLLADYNFFRGRLWILVLVATFLAPALAFRLRH
jgi:hypothetical protein